MKKRLLLIGMHLLPFSAWPLHHCPWLGNLMEFEFDAAYTYSRFTHVQNASPQLKHPSNNQFLDFALGFTPLETLDVQLEMEFAHTPRQAWGYQSTIAQVRQLWLDDVMGDPISLVFGVSVREVSSRSLKDVSCPYHARVNYEGNLAIGKEWSEDWYWQMRTYAYGAFGVGNKGSPWITSILAVEGNYEDRHQGKLFAEGYFGLGGRNHVDPHHFHGWGKYHHQSIDIGIRYRYLTQIWGNFSISYAYRVWAHTYPEHVNTILLRYELPFSFL